MPKPCICRLIPRNAQNTDICQPHRSDSISSRTPREQDHTTGPSQPRPLQWKSQWPRAVILPPQNTKQVPCPPRHSTKHIPTPPPIHRASDRPNRPPGLRLAILRPPNRRRRPHGPTLHRAIRHGEFRPLHPRSPLHALPRLPAARKVQPTRDLATCDDGRAVRFGLRRGRRIPGQRRGGGTDGDEPGADIHHGGDGVRRLGLGRDPGHGLHGAVGERGHDVFRESDGAGSSR